MGLNHTLINWKAVEDTLQTNIKRVKNLQAIKADDHGTARNHVMFVKQELQAVIELISLVE